MSCMDLKFGEEVLLVKSSHSQQKKIKKGPVKDELKENFVDMKAEMESDVSDFGDDVEEYRKRIEENVRQNQEFLRQLGIDQAKQDLLKFKEKPSKPSQRGLKKEKVLVELLPRRSSLRLQNKTPDGIELPPEGVIARAQFSVPAPDEHPRPPNGPLDMKETLYRTSSEDDHTSITKQILKQKTCTHKPASEDLQRYVDRMSKALMSAESVVKVTPERSFSVAFHPGNSRLLAATGDKWGKLGIWDVESEESSESDGVVCYCPHSRPICGLEFPVFATHSVYTCSYDGSLRHGDLYKEVFDEVYSLPGVLRNFSFTSPNTMLVSQNTGRVALVDTRTASTSAEHTYELADQSLRTVSVHPTQKDYFCTAGVGGVVCVWDLRKVSVKKSKAIVTLEHSGKTLNSAYFSPVTGKYILTTSMDDTLKIFNSSVIDSNMKLRKSIPHNNHIGRWVTGFSASWHPAREDVFVVGSMNRPREITLFSDEGKRLHSFKDDTYLGSVCSLNALHPTRDVVVGGNSSGSLHVFKLNLL
ncbi:WD repeat-containing protein 76-like isoform X2 [Mya arenaria]|uniref:WD repeat-containing protein 76-like isoform X2 n=1 Tax=Mya arenaria TaxID=6604 RepID=UPI0022E281B9|nr:WD repeat-containing protein 76-like isoform X2 [Mya arenaria]